MTTIPASQLAQVLPSVLPAGGNQLQLNGVMITQNNRLPSGTMQPFTAPASLSTYFGPNSQEYAEGVVYFNGYDNSPQKPGNLWVANYAPFGQDAFLQSAPVNTYTIPQLAALTGVINIAVDGYVRNATGITLAGATSYSAAAALLQTALNGAIVSAATVTGSIAASTSAFTGSIAGNVLTVTAVASGTLVAGTIVAGTGVTASTMIIGQLSGTTGGIGTYAVNQAAQVVPPATSLTGAYGTFTVSAVSTGTVSVGQTLSGAGVTAGTQVMQLGTGVGLTGTYYVTPSQTASSTTVTCSPTAVTVVYDSTSGSFLITSGVLAPSVTSSTVAYATGTLATSLFMTTNSGAVISQGTGPTTPGAFMSSLAAVNQNWATFFPIFNPDGPGTAGGFTQKQAFSQWANGQNNRYAAILWDPDPNAYGTVPATTTFGYYLQSNNVSGTVAIWEPSEATNTLAAMVSGMVASLSFTTLNGRTTFAARSQTGIVADVSVGQNAVNLGGNPQVTGDFGNGYNFYGAYATAAQTFLQLQRGTVSGPFLWLDSYANQIWMNANFQLDMMLLLQVASSIPYNTFGYSEIQNAMMDTINAAINFGAIRKGVNLSQLQLSQIDAQTGVIGSGATVSSRGWYVQILDAAPAVRRGRTSPPIKFFYSDGGSVQAITIGSIMVQ